MLNLPGDRILESFVAAISYFPFRVSAFMTCEKLGALTSVDGISKA